MKTIQPIRLFAAVLAGASLIAAPAEASSTNVNADADEFALSCTWSPDYDSAAGSFTFTASATCWGETPVPAQDVSISASGAASGYTSGENQVTLNLNGVQPGAVYVTFSGAGESYSATVYSLKVDIEQTREDYCIHGGSDTLDLTAGSYLGPGTAFWYWSGDQVGSGNGNLFTPSEIGPCGVTVRAEAEKLPSCDDTCEVNIVEVDVDAEGCVCVTNGTAGAASRKQIAVGKCDPAAWEGHVQLFWAGGGGVKVYTDASGGAEVASGMSFANESLPTNLWVEGTSPSVSTNDVVFRLNPVLAGHPCPKESTGCDRGTMTAVAAWLSLPVVGVNDLVPNDEDPAGYDKGFVAIAEEYDDEDDLLPPDTWNVAPRDESLGDITVTGNGRIKVLTKEDVNVEENPSFSPTDTAAVFKIEGIDYSAVSNDAEVVLTYSVCTVTARTTVVQVELDKFCYNRADPFPEVEIVSVSGLVTGGTATVTYKVLDDMLDKDLPELTDTFTVETDFGTYEYKTPDYSNRIGNPGHDAIRYTVYDNDGTKAVRWSHADPDRKALAALPSLARMGIAIKDALAVTPEEVRGHLEPTPDFPGGYGIEGELPEYWISNVVVLAKVPSPAYTNEVHPEVGNEEILQALHEVARDSAVVLEISGPRVVAVNDRFGSTLDPGDNATENLDIADPDFIRLSLTGVPLGCVSKGVITWATGSDKVFLLATNEVLGGATQVGQELSYAFSEGIPNGLLYAAIEGREASDVTDDVAVTVRIEVADAEENPRAFRGETLEAEFKLTVTDLRWIGWQEDDAGGKTAERTELLACDLDLRPAVMLEEPEGGDVFEQNASLAVSGSVRSMTDVVTDIRVNGESVSRANIRFLGETVDGLTSVSELTDRSPPYVVTFSHTLAQFDADEVRVEARNGVATSPGHAVRRVAYESSTGTVSTVLSASPAYDEPEMVEFFDDQEGWAFLYKTEVDHCGAGAGVVYVQGVETNGAQQGNGLFRLRLPAVFVSQQGLNGSIPPPGLFVRNDLAAPAEAKYNNGVNDGIRKLFVANLTVADGAGAVPDDEEWWRSALLATNDASGELTVATPFGQADIPDDAELSLAVSPVDGLANPFAGFVTLSWTADAAEGLGDPIPLTAPTNSGAAAFVLTLSSGKYGLLAKDRIRVNVPRVNLLIDSLNQHGFFSPVDSDAVEEIEDDPDEPGKILLVNDGDADLDGIPGYADGYDLLATDTNDDASAGVSFVPVVFEIPKPVDPAAAVVRLSYPASDPGAVTTNGTGGYTLPAGSLRLWAVDGSVARSTNPVWHAAAPGDYLPPTPAGGIPAVLLGFSDAVRSRTFYAEAVRPSEETGDLRILFEVDPDDRATVTADDAVRATAWTFELREVALGQDGYPLAEGGMPVLGDIIPWTDSLSTYVPYDGGGAPDLDSTSSRWVTFSAVTNAITNSATLTMTKDDVDGFKVWEMDFECVTTNGAYAWLWQGTSNAFLRAEVPTNAVGATMPLTLTYLDTEFSGLTNELQESYTLYRHDATNGYWGSTYAITDPREAMGMPAFSSRNAFVVRVSPEAAELLEVSPVCEITVGDGDPVSVPLTEDGEGAYVSCLVVPVSALDGEADLGLEASVSAIKLKVYGWTGWERITIDIGTSIPGTMKKIAKGTMPVVQAALFSALVTDEENGRARASQAVTQAGETAIRLLKLGVTPLFTPTKDQINDMLERHCIWVHSGHGYHSTGIEIVRQTSEGYRLDFFTASDVTAGDLQYDLVFMNTCESTDRKYYPVQPLPQSVGGWNGPHAYTDGTKVLDIGRKLNAKNYVGWDCEAVRQLSVGIPKMLMQELDSTGVGSKHERTVADAVRGVWDRLQDERPDYWYYGARLRLVDQDDTVILDLNRRPY